MKKTTTTATLSPIEKARATVAARRQHAESLLSCQTDPAARAELVSMLSRAVAYHNSGKIEGLFSLDVACSNGTFCPAMQARDPEEGCICSFCYTNDGHDVAHAAHAITGLILSEMDLTPAGMAAALARGEYPCNGQKCRDCGFHCYRRHNRGTGPVMVAEKLRRPCGMNQAQFVEYCAKIDARTL